MLTLHQIRLLLADRRLDVVSRGAGVHRNTIAGIRDGRIENPSYATIAKLSAYLTKDAGASSTGGADAS
jgi:transcriptional regulator with XRE-family HTH domain